MTPETISIAQRLVETGGNAGLLALGVWVLAKRLAAQYEGRIAVLETRSDICDRDRQALHETIASLQESRIADRNQRIDILERIAERVLPVDSGNQD